MKNWVGSVLSLFIFGYALVPTVSAQAQGGAAPQGDRPATSPPREREVPPQPGATQGGIATNEFDPTPKFNMDYFHGEWAFQTNVSESPLGEGGPLSGTEIIEDIYDGRFWRVTIKGDGPEGPYTGNGVVLYQDSFAGQFFTRYEFTRGLSLIKTGTLGCDLGGTCNMYWETPPFDHKGSLIRLKGRYYLTSPATYRLSTEISVDKGDYRNFGTIVYTKNLKATVKGIK